MTGMLMCILGIVGIFLFVTGKWPIDKFNQGQFIRQSNATSTISTDNTTQKKLLKHKQKKTDKSPIKKQASASKTVAAKKQPPRFEFYQLLPGMEVPLPDTTNEGNK
jgi:hypothetical protein